MTEFARDNGIQNPDAVIQDVAAALKQFGSVALKNELDRKRRTDDSEPFERVV